MIQRLSAAGLSLQGATGLMRTDPAAAAERVEGAVDDLDLTVRQIRSAVFGLEPMSSGTQSGVRVQVLDLVRDSGSALGFEPTVLFDGPVDSSTPNGLAWDLLATLREALSNVARHARAGRVAVAVAVDDATLVLRVTDDGVGPPAPDIPGSTGSTTRPPGRPAGAARSTSARRARAAPSSNGACRSGDRAPGSRTQPEGRLRRSASRAA